jgi:hypothetical protein
MKPSVAPVKQSRGRESLRQAENPVQDNKVPNQYFNPDPMNLPGGSDAILG